MLADAGLPLQTEVQDYNSKYITHTFLGDFQGIAYGLESTLTPGGYAQRFFGDDKANHGGVHEPEMEALLKKQAVEMDPEARTQIFYDMARAQAKQMYYVPAQSTSTTQWTGYTARVKGVRRTRGYGSGGEVYPYIWLDA
jgi:ABC-type transport system substrate-binding protein